MPPASVDEDLLSTLHPSPLLHAALVDYTGDSHEYDRDPRGRSFNAGAEDAARELEESLLGSRSKNKRKDPLKRPANDAVSDASSDLEIPIPAARKDKPANKKRKVDKDASAIADEFERAVNESSASPVKPSKAKGKGKVPQLREPSVESTATLPLTPKGRKKAAAKKKFDGLHPDATGLGSATGSVAGDATPSASRPASPALTTTSTVVYELDEVVPPLKRAKKVDDSAKAKRLKALEEAQRKVWTNIARRDVAKVRILCRIRMTFLKFFRYTSMRPWVIRQGRVNSRGLPCFPQCKPAGRLRAQRKPIRTFKRKRSV
jgi:DNA helicase INO80